MFKKKWLNLQLFAGEGAGDGGGEAATTGETDAAAGHQRLLELGVPADKIRKNRAYKLNTPTPNPAAAEQSAGQEQKPEQAASAENPTEEKKTDAPSRMSWEEIMADPEYNQKMQETMQKRLKTAKQAEETLGKLNTSLEALALQLGQDPANPDYDAIAKAIDDANSYFEEVALRDGTSLETATTKVKMDLDTKRQQRTLEQQKFQNHIEKLELQGQAMKQVFPNFNLRTELKNDTFARMTSPNVGISVEDAYYAVHRKELQSAAMQVTAQTVAKKISNDIQSGSRRPSEAGTSGQAPSVTTFDYRSASREQREALKKRIRSGEKIYPGQV